MTKARNNADNVSGDISEVTAGTGITVSSGTGPAPAVALTTPVASTNGGTGLSSFTTGDIIYSSSGNTLSKLGIGTTSQVLTVASGLPSWAAPASGGMTLISTTTMTGSGITLSSIPSTYNHLQLVIRSFQPATDGGLYIRFNNDGNTRYYSSVSNDLYLAGTSYNASSFTVSNTQDSGGTNGLIIVDIFDYTNTTTWKYVNSSALTQNGSTNTDINYRFGFGAWNQTSAINQLDFYPASGNFTAGSILLYGVK